MTQEQAIITYTLEQQHEAILFQARRHLVANTEEKDGTFTSTVRIKHDDYIILMNMVRARLIIAFKISLTEINA